MSNNNDMNLIIPTERIQQAILLVRGQRIILDADLARLYDTSTKRLNEQVKRNQARFPQDFMFQLTVSEKSKVVANCDHLATLKYSRTLPYAFTEHGAIMAASLLNSPRAIEISVLVVRTFIKLRQLLVSHKALRDKLAELEQRLSHHDESIGALIDAIEHLMHTPEPNKPYPIGFAPWIKESDT